jgi:hypothetical protein
LILGYRIRVVYHINDWYTLCFSPLDLGHTLQETSPFHVESYEVRQELRLSEGGGRGTRLSVHTSTVQGEPHITMVLEAVSTDVDRRSCSGNLASIQANRGLTQQLPTSLDSLGKNVGMAHVLRGPNSWCDRAARSRHSLQGPSRLRQNQEERFPLFRLMWLRWKVDSIFAPQQ